MAGLNRVVPGTGITSAWGNVTSAKTIRNFTSLAAAQAAITAAGITPEAGEMIYCADVDALYRYRAGTWYAQGAKDAARGYATANTILSVAGAVADVALGGESYDYGSRFAASKYTVPYTGLYDVRFRISYTMAAAVGDVFGVVRTGASTERSRTSRRQDNPATQIGSAVGSDVLLFNAGDVVKLSAYTSVANVTVTAAVPEETFLTIRPAA